jgi:hypothetical protein
VGDRGVTTSKLAGVTASASTAPRRWVLTIHAPMGRDGKAWWATLNGGHLHQMTVYRRANAWRQATREAAVKANIATLAMKPKIRLERARIDMAFRFLRSMRGGVRRDITTNWAPTAKAIVDTLTDDTRRIPKVPSIGIIADDSPRYLCCEQCPHLSIGDPIERGPYAPLGLVVVTIADLSDAGVMA